jgi:predicted GNAT family acetyltransferase
VNVVHDPARGVFETVVDGERSVCAYRLQGDTMVFTHTEVPPWQQGRGIAAALVAAALAHARERRLRVRPLCSYVAVYMRRHPETRELLPD